MYGWSGYRYRERPATNLIDPFKNSFSRPIFRPTCTTFLNISSVNRDTFLIQISPTYPRFNTNTFSFHLDSYEPPLRLKKLFTIIFRYKLVPLYKVSKHTFQQFKSNHTRYVKSRKIIVIQTSLSRIFFHYRSTSILRVSPKTLSLRLSETRTGKAGKSRDYSIVSL